MLWMYLLAAAVAAYLCGSVPSGFLAGRLRGVDLRKEGSGNIGATNALRVLGKTWGYGVFAADFVKGILGVVVAQQLGKAAGVTPGVMADLFGVVGAFFVVVGHMFPVWLGFNGGKGIATSGGIIIALYPWPVFAFGLFCWMFLFFATRYVSLASLAAALALPTGSLVMALLGRCGWLLVLVASLLCALAVWRHRPNITRLLQGTEKRFEPKKKASTEPGN
jgi:glycerol-3-phosphate acyltransferase PlsY